MNESTYYQLNLPSATDPVDIAKLTDNFTKIDNVLHGKLDTLITADLDLNGHRIKHIGPAQSSEDVATVGDVSVAAQQVADAALLKAGGTMTGNIAMGGNKVTGLPTPTDAGDAVNKGYVDAKTSYWTLIDSVTLTEEVSEYIKDLPAETYREVYVTVTEKIGGTISNKLVRFIVQDGYRVCGIDFKTSAGKTVYMAAHMVTLPGKGHAGIIGVGEGSWINAETSMSPGYLDSEEQDGYITQCKVSVRAAYADQGTATMAAGTKIMIWGR